MTSLLPTRVSIFDFLYIDTLPIDSVFADAGNISLPQARLIIENGIQAILSGLLAYNQTEGSEAVLKKLLQRNQVKELRKYNAFNFRTMRVAMQTSQQTYEALFSNQDIQKQLCIKLASQTALNARKVRPLFSALTLLCLRELAILADFAQLNASEIDVWLKLQPQFLSLDRKHHSSSDVDICDPKSLTIANYDCHWHKVTSFQPPAKAKTNTTDKMPHYAKVIGRTAITTHPVTENGRVIVDEANNRDILTFYSMQNINLPYQRWLLYLAKITEIYLNRNRLKVAPEPIQPPSRPFVSFGFLDHDDANNKQKQKLSQIDESNTPFWKSPVLIILVIIITVLSLMSIAKYYYKKSHSIETDNANIIINKDH